MEPVGILFVAVNGVEMQVAPAVAGAIQRYPIGIIAVAAVGAMVISVVVISVVVISVVVISVVVIAIAIVAVAVVAARRLKLSGGPQVAVARKYLPLVGSAGPQARELNRVLGATALMIG